MKTIVLISCVSKKRRLKPREKCKAKDLYISPLFKKAYAYATNLNPDYLYILSAKYGLLDVNEEVETYDDTLRRKSANDCILWSQKIITALKNKNHNLATHDKGGDKFILLAGKSYYKNLLGEEGIGNYVCPYLGCRGIGDILHFLNDNLQK